MSNIYGQLGEALAIPLLLGAGLMFSYWGKTPRCIRDTCKKLAIGAFVIALPITFILLYGTENNVYFFTPVLSAWITITILVPSFWFLKISESILKIMKKTD